MPEIVRHTKPDGIWLFDYPSLASMDDCAELLVWLSERDINIIWQAIKTIDRFRSRVFTEARGVDYTLVDLDQFSQFQEWVSDLNVHLGAYPMCNDIQERIATALERMADMGGCCGEIPGASGGTAGGGMVPADPSTTEDTPESHSGPPPPGYSDWEEFDQDKCNWANKIFDDLLADIATTEIVVIGSNTALQLIPILIPLLITPIGWVTLAALAALMIENLVLSVAYASVIDFLDDNREDLICAMMEGDNATDSIGNFNNAVFTIIDDDNAFGSDLSNYWAKKFIATFATTDSFNRMYDKQSIALPDSVCDCGDSTGYTVAFGVETSEHPSNPIVVQSEFVEGWGCTSDAREIAIVFDAEVTITEITGDTGLGCGSCSGALIYHYFANTDYTSTISDGNARPQDSSPVSGVRSMYILYDCDGNTPELTITYTID